MFTLTRRESRQKKEKNPEQLSKEHQLQLHVRQEREREMKKRTESIFWPYVARQHLRVCALSLTGLGDGCVTAGRAGCMSCSQISDTPRGMLRKEAGLMG